MRTVRVWLNHWFSTAYHIIELIKRDDDINFYVLGSNREENCVYRLVCDEWHVEPEYKSEEQYVGFCLDFCRAHDVEAFLPRRAMAAIAKRLDEFDEIGVKVLAERDLGVLDTLSDKLCAYSAWESKEIGFVPQYKAASNIAEFEAAYKSIKTDDNRVCFKFARDEGAVSFRVIDNSILDAGGLRRGIGAKITYADALTLLGNADNFPTLILMPYLAGPEVSVDCLKTESGNIIIPRYKTHGRAEKIRFDKGIEAICDKFMDVFSLNCPFNAQFRYDGEVPYFLEVNARMSGGVQFSCLATGVNIPNIAVSKLLGINKPWSFEKKETIVSYIETPVEVAKCAV
jgi:hypothetical protein